MKIYFKTGENYYSGFQKFNILGDPAFRKCLLAFLPLISMQIPAVMIIPPGMHREIFFVLLFLVYMLPVALVIAGGMPASGWRWYSAGAALYAIGIISIALGASYYFLLFIVPSIFCLMKINRIAPHLFEALGYKAPAKPAMETIFAIIAAAVMISYTWLGQALIRKSGIHIQAPEQYLWHIATCSLYYGTLWGVFYGILMRRFLDMRYNIMLPIALNTLVMSIYWIPSILGYGVKPELVVAGLLFQGFVCHFSLGMTFYFCRSTRPLLAAFVIQYLFLKTVSF